MGQYSALSDDFIIIAVSKAIVNSKTEKVEKYRRKSRAVIGAYFLILVSRALALGKGEGQPSLMGRMVRIVVLLIIPHRRGRKCGAFMNKNKNRLKLSFQPVLFGAADEARTRYLHLGKVALYQMSYGRIKKSPNVVR